MEQASSSAAAQKQPSTSNGIPEGDLMKLLRGESDSQRLAGLLLVTKLFDKKDFEETIPKVYEAIGSAFLHRLLLTGIGRGDRDSHSPDREAYLRLAVTVLAAFVRVPHIAASQDMLLKVPLVIGVLSAQSDMALIEECYEFLYLVSTAHEDGIRTFYESGGIKALALQMPTFPDGSHVMELAIRFVQLIISKLPAEMIYVEHPSELSQMVVVITKQFALLHNALKFEVLHLLVTIFSSNCSGSIGMMLQSVGGDWPTSMRVGIMDVLQNRIGPADKIQALALAEYAISICGEEWIIGQTILPGARNSFPPDRCLFLVLESSRVEVAVILNELAYLKYEASENSPNAEKFHAKLCDVAIAFALVERIIKLISKFGDNEESTSGSFISEDTLTKIIRGLDETIGVVLDYLQDAKEHGQRKGDDLLASVRVVGSYLAEAPLACKEKIEGLLGYMLSVEGEDEPNPSNSISFLLPLLCQITMRDNGIRVCSSAGAFEAVGGYLTSLIDSGGSKVENQSTIFLACDTILNFLLKIKGLQSSPVKDNPCCIKLLIAMLRWADDGATDPSIIMMSSSICSSILDFTSEEALLRHQEFKFDDLIGLARLIKRSLTDDNYDNETSSNDASSEADLRQIVFTGYSSWGDRFPRIKEYIER